MELNYNLYQLYSGFVESQMNMLSADLFFYIMKLSAFHSAKKKSVRISALFHVCNTFLVHKQALSFLLSKKKGSYFSIQRNVSVKVNTICILAFK